MIKFVDMFSGIGGFREGLTRAGGFECVGHCEIDKYANSSYNALFDTKGEWFIEDARKADPCTMPDFQLLCGGFPCQTFSIAGSRKGFGDPRGTLFFELARLAEARKPPYLLFENVPGLLSHDGGRTFATILNTLDRLGYGVEWQCLNSKDFGVPQSRNRVYIVGYLDERCRGKVFPFTETAGSSLIQTHGGHQGERVYSPEGLSCTLAANPGGFGGKTGLYEVGVPIKCATKTGYQMAQVGDSIDLSYATVNSRRGRVGKEIAHLRNKNLSLKAKGLLSQMLSLPDDWDYTLKGLAAINKESVDAIRTAIWELEDAGYVVRTRVRDERGCLRGCDYYVYEYPQTPSSGSGSIAESVPPMLEPLASDSAALGNPMQLNKEIQNKEKQNTDPILSEGESVRTKVRDNIELDLLCRNQPESAPVMQEIYELVVETIQLRSPILRLGNNLFPMALVRERLLQLTSEHIRFVLDGLRNLRTDVKNLKKYLLTMLFNAPVTLNGRTMLDVRKSVNSGFRPMLA